MSIDESRWSFNAGNLALDFANTMDWHASSQPEELLNSYADLVNWACAFFLFSREEAQLFLAESSHRPELAAKALENAIALRDSIYRIFTAIAQDEEPEEDDLNKLKETWAQAITEGNILPQDKGVAWNWASEPQNFEHMLWPVTRAAVDLLFSTGPSQIGQCADDRGCGLLFIDTSRNHSRQWCSMDTCGNRAKARRHYQRSKRKE